MGVSVWGSSGETKFVRLFAEFPRFTAALAFLSLTNPATGAELLETRAATLRDRVATHTHVLATSPLPRVLLIEDDYTLAMTRAELRWLEDTINQLRHGTLSWNTDQLIADADQLRDATPTDHD